MDFLKIDNQMVKEHSLYLMDESMKGNGRVERKMVKEHGLIIMETSMLGNSKMMNFGTEQHTTKTETSI